MAGHSVLDRAHPAGVGSDIPADAGGQLARVNRVPQPGIGGSGVQVGQRHPGLHDGDLVGGVDLEDLVHPVERDQQPTLDWSCGPRQAAPGPAGRHRHTVFRGGLQQLGNLFGGGRLGGIGWRPLAGCSKQMTVLGVGSAPVLS